MPFFTLLLFTASAMAQDAARPTEPATEETTRLEVDDEAGVIRFIINGQEQARIDGTGLHAREDVSYGGMLTDHGHVGFDEHTKPKETP